MRYERILHKLARYSNQVFSQSNLLSIVKFTRRKMSTDPKALEKSKFVLKDMYFAGVKAVSPKTLMLNKVKFKDGILYVGDQSFELKENVYLVGFGKAVMGMAVVLEHMLGSYLKRGVVSVPSASTDSMWKSCIIVAYNIHDDI